MAQHAPARGGETTRFCCVFSKAPRDRGTSRRGTVAAQVKVMKQSRLFAFLALCCAGLLPAALGCQAQVIGGGSGGSGGQGGGGTTPTTSSGVPETPAPSGNARPAEGGYLVTLADYPLFNIGAAFWGLVAGLVVSVLLERGDFTRGTERPARLGS